MADHRRQTKETLGFPRRGEIYLVEFDPTVGHEIRKTRPAVIIQNDVSNRHSAITIVAALTSRYANPPYPREVAVEPSQSGLLKPSAVLLNQIRSVDRERLIRRLGRLDRSSMERVDYAIKISLGLIDF